MTKQFSLEITFPDSELLLQIMYSKDTDNILCDLQINLLDKMNVKSKLMKISNIDPNHSW